MYAHLLRSWFFAACTAFAGVGQAQTNDSSGAGDSPAAAAAAARTVNAPRPAAPTGTNVMTLTNSNVLGADGSRRVFASLDRQHKGYLTRDDVAADSYLSEHFSDCDKNADAQLSRGEVEACLHARGR